MQLLSEGAQQEAKELLVAYTVLASEGHAMNADAAKARANSVLRELEPHHPVEFDIDDALHDLSSAGVLERSDAGLTVKGVDDAKRALFSGLMSKVHA